MLFNSFIFIGLVLVTFFLYYLPKLSRYQVTTLIISSFIFYAWHNPALLALLISSALINILTSYQVAYGKFEQKKSIATLGVIFNLSILAFFKYSGLISYTISPENDITDFLISIPLPIGISFFTFQGISLMVDVYKENYFSNKDVIPKSFLEHARNTLFFISFFPQLVAGPIVKSHDFLPQIKRKRFEEIDWNQCFKEIIMGYFLKMVVADNLKDYTFWIAFPYFLSKDTVTLITMLFGYSCQIFADFAGYSFIAIGIARLFGYKLKKNFDLPYISSSFKEFWKRWHISLSSFLMEYLYIPLGGNRKGKYRTYLNLMITMILGGIWHGANWSFAVWGAFHGLALVFERLLKDFFSFKLHTSLKFLKPLVVFSSVTLAWLLFKLTDFGHVLSYLQAIFFNSSLPIGVSTCTWILLYSSPIIFYHVIYMIRKKVYFPSFGNFQIAIYGLMLFFIMTNSGIPGDFIYFQF